MLDGGTNFSSEHQVCISEYWQWSESDLSFMCELCFHVWLCERYEITWRRCEKGAFYHVACWNCGLRSCIWRPFGEIRKWTKLRLFSSSIRSVLLYGSGAWRTAKSTTVQVLIQTFISCLRWSSIIHWAENISNTDLQQGTGQQPVEEEIKRRWWTGSATHTTLTQCQYHQETRKRGRTKEPWPRDLERDISWKQLERKAQDRRQDNSLCSMKNER